MKTKFLPLGLALALVLCSCATATFVTGRDFDTTHVSEITKGQTTVSQLQAWMGAPYSKSVNSDGTEKWLWLYSQGKSHAQSYVVSMKVKTEMTGKRLTADVKDGVVVEFSYTDGPL